MLNLSNRRINKIIKYYILNKASIDIDEKQKFFKDKPNLLDNVAIFLRILDKNIIEELNLSNDYIRHYKIFEEFKSKLDYELKKIVNAEQEISNMIEKYINKPSKSDKKEIQYLFMNNLQNTDIEEIKNTLEKSEAFHKELLSNYGKFHGNYDQDNLNIKQGSMFRYFELCDLMLEKTTVIIKEIDEYKIYNIKQKEYDDKISNINTKILYEIANICNQRNDIFTTFMDDIDKFLDIGK